MKCEWKLAEKCHQQPTAIGQEKILESNQEISNTRVIAK